MKKRLSLFSILLINILTSFNLVAQYRYELADIPFYFQNDTLDARLNGLNSPVFAEIDLNLDGKNDLLVLEIFGDHLYPFINVGDSGEVNYEYQPSYLDQLPKDIEDWVATADYNCDGKLDLFYMHNEYVMVYENLSTPTKFQLGNPKHITYLNRGFQERLNLNDIYKPAFQDINGDGDIDILHFQNGQIRYLRNVSMEKTSTCGLDFEVRAKCWGLFTENNATSVIHLDTCEMGKDAINERTKGNKHAGGTVLAFDIDGNETMDILVGDVSQSHLTLLINGDNTPNKVSSHMISADDDFPSYDKPIRVNNTPAAYYIDVNNDGLKDLIISPFNSDPMEPAWTENMVHYYKNVGNNVTALFEFQTPDFLIDKVLDIGRGAHPVLYDINNDGLLDIIAGNMGRYDSTNNQFIGSLAYFKNVGSATSPEFELVDTDFAGISQIKLQGGYYAKALFPAIADIDNDGKAEMFIGDDYGKIHLFRDSSSNPANPDFRLVTKYFDNIGLFGNRNCSPTLYDLNKDGLLDLIIAHEYGTVDYYPNWGTATNPVFNFEVDSVIFQRDSVVRYYFDSKYDISKLQIGQKLNFIGSTAFENSGKKEILLINTADGYVDVIHPYASTQYHTNEQITDKVAFYGIDSLGNINLTRPNTANGMPTPFFYEYENQTKMLSGSKEGTIFFFEDIDGNLDSSFTLRNSDYLNLDFGRYAYLSGGDLNSDGDPDILIGNMAGGFKIYFANGIVGIDEHQRSQHISFDLYPNPSNGDFTIDLKDFFRYNDLNLSVYDMLGKEVKSQVISRSRMSISLQEVPSGMYFVRVFNKDLSLVKKVTIRH